MLTVLFLAEKINRQKLFFKSASLNFSHAWKICILEKQATEVILVGWFGKCQSIKKVGGRRFVEGLFQVQFSFCLARRNVITKRNENWAWSKVTSSRAPSLFIKSLRLLRIFVKFPMCPARELNKVPFSSASRSRKHAFRSTADFLCSLLLWMPLRSPCHWI